MCVPFTERGTWGRFGNLEKLLPGLYLGNRACRDSDVIWGQKNEEVQELALDPGVCGLVYAYGLGHNPLETAYGHNG